jgi:hypothetical protein
MKNILYIGDPNSIHDIKWISYFSDKPNHYKTYFIYEKQLNINFSETTQKLKSKNITLLKPISTFSLIQPFSTIKSIISINQHIKKLKIDITHILFASPHALWGIFLKTSFIITTRGSDVLKVIPSLKMEKGIKGIYFKLLFYLLKLSFKKANSITSTSYFQIEHIYDMFSVKSELIKTGIPFNDIQKKKNQNLLHPSLKNKKFIFSPRFFSPIYNISIQIDAIKHLKKEIINTHIFVFIKGRNYDSSYALKIEKKLNSLSETLKINYVILNFLSQKEMWCYFQNTSLTIMTPISDGTPNSALEAMASKSPLIISDLPHLDKNLFSNTCKKFKGNNPEILAKEIELCISNYPSVLINNALRIVEQKGNRNIEMKKIEIIYESINQKIKS